MAKENIKSTMKLVNDPKYKALVDQSIAEADSMIQVLSNSGKSPEEAQLLVQQAYFKNLKLAGDPAAMMQKTMGELATRIELDRILNPESDLVSEKYQTLVDLQIKAIKAQAALNKSSTILVQKSDDSMMNFDFIDVEDS